MGSVEITRLFLEKGAQVDAKNVVSRTPLFYAVRYGNAVMQNMLYFDSKHGKSN